MSELGNDKAGCAANEAIRAEMLAASKAAYDASTCARRKRADRQYHKLRRRYYGNKYRARARGDKHRKVKCQFCGEAERLHAHHINGNAWDNRPSNIGTLCADCHELMHSWMMPRWEWCRSARRRLWLDVLNDAGKGPLKWDYEPPMIRRSRELQQKLGRIDEAILAS